MKTIAMIVATWAVLAISAAAQMDMPKPGAEVKKLEMFSGSWTLDGDMKPSSMGPGGKTTQNKKCEWMEGGFFLMCKMDFKNPMGNGSGLTIMGYSTEDKNYVYREFNSWGEFMDSKGTLDGDTWTWVNDEKMNDMTMKWRFVMKVTSATSYDFTYEMSQDGSKWTMVMDGKATKGK